MARNPLIISDEPANVDLLGRDVYARTLHKVAQSCQTPIVIGIHGDWGSGKTSLMLLTKKLLEKKGTKTVWFNPWMYQFDESPIIPLLNEIKKQAIFYKVKIEGLKLFSLLTSLTSETILRLATGGNVGTDYLLKGNKDFEEKYFEIKSITMNIHKCFQEVVDAIVGKKGRLVIFIDDLDRCGPSQCLKVLEAIKLFLNVDKCVFVVGLDREVIEQAVEYQYGDINISGNSYLEKIIQLPFNIPPVTDEGVDKFLERIKHTEIDFAPFYGIIRKGTSHNPRAIKRFINSFLFNYFLAQEIKIQNFEAHVLIKILILQLRFPRFFVYVSKHKEDFLEIESCISSGKKSERLTINLKIEEILKDNDLTDFLREKPLIAKDITQYISLTNITRLQSTQDHVFKRICTECGLPLEFYQSRQDIDHIFVKGEPDVDAPYCVDVYRCKNGHEKPEYHSLVEG
jgi:hypothetical protein